MKNNIIIIVITVVITILAVLGVQFLLQNSDETKLSGNKEQVNNVEIQEDEKNNVEAEYVENIVEGTVENTQNNNEVISENTNVSENTTQIEEQENDDISQMLDDLEDKSQDVVEVEEQPIDMGMMENYQIVGMLRIPDINLEYPVLEKATVDSLKLSIALSYGELNEADNSVIWGHFSHFENLTQLEVGDTIYVKDPTNRELTYEILEKKDVSKDDVSYYTTKIEGKKALALQTGSNLPENRFVIIAAEKK